jgi:7-carboxy-7-deazaguanine synthase
MSAIPAVAPAATPGAAADTPRLRIAEIFHSVQGESSRVGLPTVFVRLTGCPLRCRWCDTEYAFSGGEMLALEAILERVAGFGCDTVCVTGGEPLAQRHCATLLAALCEAGYRVSLETSGALDIGGLDSRVSRIMDLKAPGSGEVERNRWENLALLTPHDEVKFVLASRADYDWAVSASRQRRLLLTGPDGGREIAPVPLLFSPVHGELAPADLAQWILDDRLPVRFQLQLHKLLWADARGR